MTSDAHAVRLLPSGNGWLQASRQIRQCSCRIFLLNPATPCPIRRQHNGSLHDPRGSSIPRKHTQPIHQQIAVPKKLDEPTEDLVGRSPPRQHGAFDFRLPESVAGGYDRPGCVG